jgi:hypothetical protein
MKPEKIIEACQSSASMAEAAVKLGISFYALKKQAIQLGVYKPNPNGKGIKKTKADGRDKYSLDDILEGKHPQYSSHKLRLRLIAAGIKEDKCEVCGVVDWNGNVLPKHLDHKDGNHYNHSLDNLRILCPNCHQQTDTHGSKKLKITPR